MRAASDYFYMTLTINSILGWYHMEAAFRSDEDGDRYHHFTESASYYIQAAEMYPEDDLLSQDRFGSVLVTRRTP